MKRRDFSLALFFVGSLAFSAHATFDSECGRGQMHGSVAGFVTRCKKFASGAADPSEKTSAYLEVIKAQAAADRFSTFEALRADRKSALPKVLSALISRSQTLPASLDPGNKLLSSLAKLEVIGWAHDVMVQWTTASADQPLAPVPALPPVDKYLLEVASNPGVADDGIRAGLGLAASILYETNQHDKAITMLKQVSQSRPGLKKEIDPQIALALAAKLQFQPAYRMLLAAGNQDSVSYARIADIARGDEYYLDAVAGYRQAVKYAPTPVGRTAFRYELALSFHLGGDDNAAADVITEARAEMKGLKDPRYVMALRHWELELKNLEGDLQL